MLTGWNGLAISAFAYAYEVLREERYLEAATKSCNFIKNHLMKDDVLYRRYRDGHVAVDGTLEDYSFFIGGLIDLYEASFDLELLELAVRLSRLMIELFWDKADGGFLLNSSNELPIAIKEAYDGPMPSGNSVGALDLLRLGELTGDSMLKERGEKTLQVFANAMDRDPSSHTLMLSTLDFYLGPTREIVVVADKRDREVEGMAKEIQKRFMPDKVLLISTAGASRSVISRLTEGKTPMGGRPTVYICENFACNSPISDIE